MYNFMSYVIAESDIWELMVIKLHNTFIQGWWHDSQCNERARGAFVHDGLELPSSCKREFIVIVFQHCSNELNIPETENILLGKCNKTLFYILEKEETWTLMDELFQIFFIQVGLKFLTHNERKILTWWQLI